jgi:hypothetical protein
MTSPRTPCQNDKIANFPALACRHLVKDRMDLTGARWGLAGAEAILKLRALITNGDFDAYWNYHLTQEKQHVHANRYTNGIIPG